MKNHPEEFKDTMPYVYGFDESPKICIDNIRTLYGRIKQVFPQIQTAAVLNWKSGLPIDLPVDIWIIKYIYHKKEIAEKW